MQTVAEIESPRERAAYAAQAEPDVRCLLMEPNEVVLLHRVLSNYLVDLHSEIGHTDRYELRQALKRDREAVVALVGQLAVLAADVVPVRGD